MQSGHEVIGGKCHPVLILAELEGGAASVRSSEAGAKVEVHEAAAGTWHAEGECGKGAAKQDLEALEKFSRPGGFIGKLGQDPPSEVKSEPLPPEPVKPEPPKSFLRGGKAGKR